MKIIQVTSSKAIANLVKEMVTDFGIPYWGTEEKYTKFNQHLENSPYEVATGKYWALVEDDVNEQEIETKSDTFLAACETYARSATLKVENEEIHGNCYGVTLVFVIKNKRKRGYSSSLLDLVIKQIQNDDLKCLGFYLHSVVGASVYERVGFQVVPTYEWYFPPKEDNHENPKITRFSQAEVRSQWSSIQDSNTLEEGEFIIRSSIEELDWHFMMEFGNEDKYSERGLALGKSNLIFRIDPFSHSLSSFHCSFSSLEETSALIEEAQHIAFKIGVKELLLIEDNSRNNWNLLEKVGGVRRPRKKYLTMLRPVHPKLKSNMWKQVGLSDWL